MNTILSRNTPNSPAPLRTVLELEVNNHAGVMSHVVGLFARRAYNVEGILCMPIGDGAVSRIWLMVGEDARLEQTTRKTDRRALGATPWRKP